jgi:hypothetical protein
MMLECLCQTKHCKLWKTNDARLSFLSAFRHYGIHAFMHIHCPGPCRMTKSVLRVHIHAACLCPCCMSMSILHVHVHTACHVHVACSCQCCIPCQCSIPSQCCILCQCFMSMSMSMYIYAEMPDCSASSQSGTGLS